jgi:hydrogenase maturation protease
VAAFVIAMGNTLRGDDGVAWRIAEELRETLGDPGVEVVMVHQLSPELAHPISRAETVIFVDAAADMIPGKIKMESIEAENCPTWNFTHAVSPGALLALTRSLYRTLPMETLLLTIGARSFAFSEELSGPVQRVIPEAIARIRQVIETKIEVRSDSQESDSNARPTVR